MRIFVIFVVSRRSLLLLVQTRPCWKSNAGEKSNQEICCRNAHRKLPQRVFVCLVHLADCQLLNCSMLTWTSLLGFPTVPTRQSSSIKPQRHLCLKMGKTLRSNREWLFFVWFHIHWRPFLWKHGQGHNRPRNYIHIHMLTVCRGRKDVQSNYWNRLFLPTRPSVPHVSSPWTHPRCQNCRYLRAFLGLKFSSRILLCLKNWHFATLVLIKHRKNCECCHS